MTENYKWPTVPKPETLPPPAPKPQCEWREDDDGDWETSCDNLFTLTCDKPLDHGMVFCCFCGGELFEVPFEDDWEDDDDDN